MSRLDLGHVDTLPLAYTPDGPVWADEDGPLVRDWSERRRFVVGLVIVVAFVLFVTLVAAGT